MGRYDHLDESSVRERPSRRNTRPRTKDRPTYDDAVPAVVVTVDRGRYTCRLVEGDFFTSVPAGGDVYAAAHYAQTLLEQGHEL